MKANAKEEGNRTMASVKSVECLLLSLATTLLLHALCHAGEAVPDVLPSPAQVSERLSHYFKVIRGFHYTVNQETTVPSDGSQHSERFSYTGMGAFFLYESTDHLGTFTVAYNGDSHQNLKNGQLILRKQRRILDFEVSEQLGMLDPFVFFNSDKCTQVYPILYTIPTQESLASEAAWAARLRAVTEWKWLERDSHRLRRATMPGGIVPGTNLVTLFHVFLDPHRDFFPVAWERFSADGEWCEAYKVEEFESISTNAGEAIVYPRKASKRFYDESGKDYFFKTEATVEDVRVGADYDNTAFTIDTSRANTIYNADTKVTLDFPNSAKPTQ